MAKKVSEILKELNIGFTEMKGILEKLGISVKNQNDVLSDVDSERVISTVRLLKGDVQEEKSTSAKPAIKAVPISKTNSKTPAAKKINKKKIEKKAVVDDEKKSVDKDTSAEKTAETEKTANAGNEKDVKKATKTEVSKAVEDIVKDESAKIAQDKSKTESAKTVQNTVEAEEMKADDKKSAPNKLAKDDIEKAVKKEVEKKSESSDVLAAEKKINSVSKEGAKVDSEDKVAFGTQNEAPKEVVASEAPVQQKEEEPEEYKNAPNKPMRFKKIYDASAAPKEEPKQEIKSEQKQEGKQQNKDNKNNRNSKDNTAKGKEDRRNKNDKSAPSDKKGTSNKKDDRKSSADHDKNVSGDKRNISDNKKSGRDNKSGQNVQSGQKSSGARQQGKKTADAVVAEPVIKDNKKSQHNKGKSKRYFENPENDGEKKNKFEKKGDGGGKNRTHYYDDRSLEKQTRNKKKNKPKHEEEIDILETLPEGTIAVSVPITVAGLSEQADISPTTIIMALMNLGVMATLNQSLDKDMVEMLAADLGIEVAIVGEEEEILDEGLDLHVDTESELKPRAPIITVMGHVDHGKTSLLDAIRNTNVTAGESGGITQHIGASEVNINGKKIVFLDTPGHEAFTTMRARGAQVTDIAVLVVAADDSVKPQTIESISHAKAANVPIIVAINKMDKPDANPEKVKADLAEHGVLVEEWGGEVIAVPVSAKTGEGITDLLEMILLQAEMLELKANPDRLALGSVIEARLDKSMGPIATLLVTNGTLKSGQSVVAGTCAGKIRKMTNYKGDEIRKAGPATAVEILGLSDVPMAGDAFNAVQSDKLAREIAENRKEKMREEVLARNASTSLEKFFSQMQAGDVKELNLVIKADVQGSVGAIISSLEKLDTDDVKVNIIHSGVGTVTESDVMLAETSGAIIIGFNVRPTTAVTNQAHDANVEIRLYRVIYDIIDDISDAMKGLLDPEFVEEVIGKAEIRNTFKVPNVGIVGGAYVTEGKIQRNAQIRLVRDGIVIHEGTISSLRRFKDDVREVATGYECGVGIENYNDLKEGDVFECFQMVEVER